MTTPRPPVRIIPLALASTLALASAPSTAVQQAPVFATQAEIVTVDVVVLDGDGKPVSGLKRSDFAVKEDGKPQALTAFEAIEARVPALAAPETTTAPSFSRVATNVVAPPTRRTFAIVFDDLHVGDINIEQAKRAVETFVTRRTVAGDRVVLVTVSDGRYWATTRAADDDGWREALQRVRSHRLGRDRLALQMSSVEAMRIVDLGDDRTAERVRRRRAILSGLCVWTGVKCECSNGPSGASGSAGDGCIVPPGAPGAEETNALTRRSLGQTLRVLREISRQLAQKRERKALVLVSEGFILDPSFEGFRQVREECARANVVIHFLDARGLATGPEFFSAGGSTGSIPAEDIGPTRAMWRIEDAGSKTLAEETGGRVLQTNDFVSGLAQVAEESRVTYLLGYEPTNEKRDGRYRKLKVEVARPGLTVRARAGYFAEKGKKKAGPEPSVVDRVARDPFDADGIPLRLAAYVMGAAALQSPVPKTGLEVLIAGEIRLDALATQAKGGRLVTEPKLTLLATSRSGESHVSDWTLEVDLARSVEGATPAQVWHPFLTRIVMAPGDHRARLVAESGGKVGSVTVDFDVPGFEEERLATPILSDRLVERPTGRGVMPVVRREFERGTTLQCWLELHGAAKDDATGLARAAAGFAVRSADGREWASGPAVEMKAEAGRLVRLVSVPLADAPAGESEIVLTVRDEVSRRTFEAREPFRVTAQEAPAAGIPVGGDRP